MSWIAQRDERETSVDHAADRLAYLALTYALLVDVAYRSFVNHEAAWDLLALVVGSGAVGALYRLRGGVVTRSWLIGVGVAVGGAFVVAILVAFVAR